MQRFGTTGRIVIKLETYVWSYVWKAFL